MCPPTPPRFNRTKPQRINPRRCDPVFVGWRDALFAKGRFVLIGATVTLMTLLLVMLTGLTAGLGQQNTDALNKMGADHFVFAPTEPTDRASFTDSTITSSITDSYAGAEGTNTATPIGISTGRASKQGAASLTVLATPEGSDLLHQAVPLLQGQAPSDGHIALPSDIAEEIKAQPGDTIDFSGTTLTVSGITGPTYYSHTSAGWVTTSTWQTITHHRITEGPDAVVGTVLALTGTSTPTDLAPATGTTITNLAGAYQALPAYSSENRSLTMMQGFLYAISALVIISFLTIWTIQRTRDIAVMRALGASRSFIARDALAQAALILALGTATGALTGWGLGALAATSVPFNLTPLTVLGPSTGVWLIGMGGALIALRRATSVDPLLALGGN